MMLGKRSLGMRGLSVVLALGVLLATGAVAFSEDEETVKRNCEQALMACLGDAAIAGLFSNPLTTLVSLMFCGIGYDWCERYVAPLIRN
jgi:hypothetical protein